MERAKRLYLMEQSRAWIRRRQGRKSLAELGLRLIPDNSEPWLPGGVRSVAGAIWISDRIMETSQQWGIKLPQQN